jgi:hypothetical protein
VIAAIKARPRFNYNQLFISFDTFKLAATQVHSMYDDPSTIQGYHNFMRYWSQNGNAKQIGYAGEYQGPFLRKDRVVHTYSDFMFWVGFDCTESATGSKNTPIQWKDTMGYGN